MNVPAGSPRPDLETLFALFPPAGDVPDCEIIPADQVPQPYYGLLVHEYHMTVTVEAHHGDFVDVVVLNRYRDDDVYARKILLALQRSRRIVQFGIVCVDLTCCSLPVREEIIAEKTPFGRILIKHNVMRRIEPTAFLRVEPCPAITKWFGIDPPRPTYGRLAIIHCDEQPAVELLEIVAPE
jgi:hypothetical protein